MKTRNTYNGRGGVCPPEYIHVTTRRGEPMCSPAHIHVTANKGRQTLPLRRMHTLGRHIGLPLPWTVILLLSSFIFQLSSCTSEDDPVAPSLGTLSRIVTVQLNAEAKPAFGQVESGKMTDESTETRAADPNCTLYSELCTLPTRSADSGWAEGDEVIAYVVLPTANSYLNSYSTLKRTAEGNWQVVENKFFTIDTRTDVYYDYHLLAEETLTSLDALTVKVPEGETVTNVKVQLIYAPEAKWNITRTDGTITSAIIQYGSICEQWLCLSTDTKGWYTDQARIRIHTGVANDVVNYGNTIATTTNSAGDAYFYLTEIGGNITITRNDVTITLVPAGTAITAGQAYVNTLAAGLQVVDGSSNSISEGTEMLYIKGTEMSENLSVALKYREVTTLILPDVTEIPQSFFLECKTLESVSAPKATTIGQTAFHNCTALKDVNLPAATTIGNNAFYNCSALTSVTFGSVITSIGDHPFYNANTTNCTLTLAEGQKESTGITTRPEGGSLAPNGNTWAGYTWKEIKFTE